MSCKSHPVRQETNSNDFIYYELNGKWIVRLCWHDQPQSEETLQVKLHTNKDNVSNETRERNDEEDDEREMKDGTTTILWPKFSVSVRHHNNGESRTQRWRKMVGLDNEERITSLDTEKLIDEALVEWRHKSFVSEIWLSPETVR